MSDKEFVLKVPVLLIIFNRPDTTYKVFERIRMAKPPKLFIASDGPRANRPGEAEKVQECRKIKDMVDWDCEVYTDFSKVNLGCKYRPASAITGAFNHTDKLIILEDDCLANLSFFRFCQEMLDKYENDNRIMSISGDNEYEYGQFEESYTFSKFFKGWGWATWKRVWDLYDIDMKIWPEVRKNHYLKYVMDYEKYIHYTNELNLTSSGMDAWDYQCALLHFMNNALCIIPKVNMIRNIGCGANSTHSAQSVLITTKYPYYMDEELEFPLVHPTMIFPRDKKPEPAEPRLTVEDMNLEINEKEQNFMRLIQNKDYQGIVNYFKNILENEKFFHARYVYFFAYGHLMLKNYYPAVQLAKEILMLNLRPPQDFFVFLNVLLQNEQKADALEILDLILSKLSNISNELRNQITALIKSNLNIFSPQKYPNIARNIQFSYTPPLSFD
ncbi:MAG: hypothetical protein IJT73_08535 [Selenomonadaceae bacterium]|nr:hypothetical protein [Selenomonadaceae bacterium]